MKSLVAAVALVAAAGAANAQVQFRIIERTGQTQITSAADAVLDFAVQARVTSGTGFLGNFAFDISALGEADANGTLAKLLISNADGTYNANAGNTVNGTTGRGGLARPYSYLAGINPNFAGLINSSGGTFTNTAGNQEIGLVTGSPTGQALLDVTDLDFDGNPDGFTGTTASVDSGVASTYFGGNNTYVDVYRFKYTVSNLGARTITFNLANLTAQIGTSLVLSNGVWGPVQANATATSSGVSVAVVPAPASAALLGLGGLVAARRRRN